MDESKRLWTQEQRAKIDDWLAHKWTGDKLCPVCQSINLWEIGESPAIISTTNNDGSVTFVGGGYPCFVMVCTFCGHTILINTLVVGIQVMPETKEPVKGVVAKEAGNA